MDRYSLAEHAFVCRSDEHIVILDIKADRYWAVRADLTAGLSSRVRGWPVGCVDSRSSHFSEGDVDRPVTDGECASDLRVSDTATALETLLGLKILVRGELSGKDATPVGAVTAAEELLSETLPDREARVGSWLAFAWASAFASFALRVLPFESVIRRVRQRKASRGITASPESDPTEHLRGLVEAFVRFRVFAFTSRDRCLFDSLALLEFLAQYDVHPDWIFGVHARPFAAHCWIQCGAVVCNDTVENVSGYTPIMVV